MTTKEYLRQAYRLDQKINCDIAEAEQLRAIISEVSSPAFGDKVQTSASGDAPFVVRLEKVMELEKEIDREIDLYVDLKNQVYAVISAIPDMDERLILHYRYILNHTWERIGIEMGMDARTVRRRHGRALAHVIMPENPIKI